MLTQGYPNIEYLVMDGGSTDGSVEIIRRHAELVASGEWPVRCRGIAMSWVSERDEGQTAAINTGLSRATGDILSYINSDDLYFPGAFQRVSSRARLVGSLYLSTVRSQWRQRSGTSALVRARIFGQPSSPS